MSTLMVDGVSVWERGRGSDNSNGGGGGDVGGGGGDDVTAGFLFPRLGPRTAIART